MKLKKDLDYSTTRTHINAHTTHKDRQYSLLLLLRNKTHQLFLRSATSQTYENVYNVSSPANWFASFLAIDGKPLWLRETERERRDRQILRDEARETE